MKTYTRVEVIGESGREYVGWCEHSVVECDGGRTLKIFKTLPEKPTRPSVIFANVWNDKPTEPDFK